MTTVRKKQVSIRKSSQISKLVSYFCHLERRIIHICTADKPETIFSPDEKKMPFPLFENIFLHMYIHTYLMYIYISVYTKEYITARDSPYIVNH